MLGKMNLETEEEEEDYIQSLPLLHGFLLLLGQRLGSGGP
jgi:hypothetical protein